MACFNALTIAIIIMTGIDLVVDSYFADTITTYSDFAALNAFVAPLLIMIFLVNLLHFFIVYACVLYATHTVPSVLLEVPVTLFAIFFRNPRRVLRVITIGPAACIFTSYCIGAVGLIFLLEIENPFLLSILIESAIVSGLAVFSIVLIVSSPFEFFVLNLILFFGGIAVATVSYFHFEGLLQSFLLEIGIGILSLVLIEGVVLLTIHKMDAELENLLARVTMRLKAGSTSQRGADTPDG